MPVAVITGASRGLGAALAHALDRARLGPRRRRPRRRRAGRCRRVEHRCTPYPATSPTPPTAQALADTAGGSAAPTCSSTTPARSAPARCRRSPTSTADVLADTLLTNVVAPHALTRLLLPQLLAQRGTVLNVTSDASVEAYEGWGAYGASKAALDQLTRILAAEQPDAARLRRRPRRHAHRGCTRTPSRARTSPTGPSRRPSCPTCWRCSTAPCPAAATAPPTSPCGPVHAHERRPPSTCPSHGEATRRPRPAGWPATRSGCSSPAPTGSSTGRCATCPTSSTPATCSSSTPRATLPAAAGRRRPVHVSTQLDDGDWVVELRRPDNDGPAGTTDGAVLHLPGGVDLHVRGTAPRRAAPALAGHAAPGDRPDDVPHRARPPDHATPTSRASGRSRHARTSTPRSRAARRCPARDARCPSGCSSP